MGTKTVSSVRGIVGIAVLALLAVAVIAGQSRANLPNDVLASAGFDVAASAGVVVGSGSLLQLETLPRILVTVMGLNDRRTRLVCR